MTGRSPRIRFHQEWNRMRYLKPEALSRVPSFHIAATPSRRNTNNPPVIESRCLQSTRTFRTHQRLSARRSLIYGSFYPLICLQVVGGARLRPKTGPLLGRFLLQTSCRTGYPCPHLAILRVRSCRCASTSLGLEHYPRGFIRKATYVPAIVFVYDSHLDQHILSLSPGIVSVQVLHSKQDL